jgi:hypothetical protein
LAVLTGNTITCDTIACKTTVTSGKYYFARKMPAQVAVVSFNESNVISNGYLKKSIIAFLTFAIIGAL